MGDNLYTSYWQSVLPSIVEQFKTEKQSVSIEIKELAQYGDRPAGYYSSFRIINGMMDNPKNAHAPGRDLYAVLTTDDFFKDFFPNKTIHAKISKDLILTMEVTATNAPEFFTEQDFIELSRFTKQTMDNQNPAHNQTDQLLKETYNKVEYWAKTVQQDIFPAGTTELRKRPTNQASKFEFYQWAKIYPDKSSADYHVLAFTVGLNSDQSHFSIKIDTVSLPDSDTKRQLYLAERGDYFNSVIVKVLPKDQVLDKGWNI